MVVLSESAKIGIGVGTAVVVIIVVIIVVLVVTGGSDSGGGGGGGGDDTYKYDCAITNVSETAAGFDERANTIGDLVYASVASPDGMSTFVSRLVNNPGSNDDTITTEYAPDMTTVLGTTANITLAGGLVFKAGVAVNDEFIYLIAHDPVVTSLARTMFTQQQQQPPRGFNRYHAEVPMSIAIAPAVSVTDQYIVMIQRADDGTFLGESTTVTAMINVTGLWAPDQVLIRKILPDPTNVNRVLAWTEQQGVGSPLEVVDLWDMSTPARTTIYSNALTQFTLDDIVTCGNVGFVAIVWDGIEDVTPTTFVSDGTTFVQQSQFNINSDYCAFSATSPNASYFLGVTPSGPSEVSVQLFTTADAATPLWTIDNVNAYTTGFIGLSDTQVIYNVNDTMQQLNATTGQLLNTFPLATNTHVDLTEVIIFTTSNVRCVKRSSNNVSTIMMAVRDQNDVSELLFVDSPLIAVKE